MRLSLEDAGNENLRGRQERFSHVDHAEMRRNGGGDATREPARKPAEHAGPEDTAGRRVTGGARSRGSSCDLPKGRRLVPKGQRAGPKRTEGWSQRGGGWSQRDGGLVPKGRGLVPKGRRLVPKGRRLGPKGDSWIVPTRLREDERFLCADNYIYPLTTIRTTH